MAKSTATPSDDMAGDQHAAAKSHFSKAIEEAKAGAQALGKDAQGRAESYRERMNQAAGEWTEEARIKGEDAKARAFQFANDGKAKTSEAIVGLSKLVEDNASTIDETVGVKYGDYARSAARSMQDAAARLDAKELEELGEDAMEFVRKQPALAIGLAAATGYALARLFRGSKG